MQLSGGEEGVILDKPVDIKVAEDQPSHWDPTGRVIYLGEGYTPLDAAHEIAHVKLGHDMSGSPLVDMVQEKDAWIEALRRMDPREVRVRDISNYLDSYLKNVDVAYGGSHQHTQMASRMKEEVIDYARKRKKEVR